MNNQLNVSPFCSAVTKGLMLSWETNKSSFTSGFDCRDCFGNNLSSQCFKKDVEKLEGFQRRVVRMITGLSDVFYSETQSAQSV